MRFSASPSIRPSAASPPRACTARAGARAHLRARVRARHGGRRRLHAARAEGPDRRRPDPVAGLADAPAGRPGRAAGLGSGARVASSRGPAGEASAVSSRLVRSPSGRPAYVEITMLRRCSSTELASRCSATSCAVPPGSAGQVSRPAGRRCRTRPLAPAVASVSNASRTLGRTQIGRRHAGCKPRAYRGRRSPSRSAATSASNRPWGRGFGTNAQMLA